jgi:hypothetical protein
MVWFLTQYRLEKHLSCHGFFAARWRQIFGVVWLTQRFWNQAFMQPSAVLERGFP